MDPMGYDDGYGFPHQQPSNEGYDPYGQDDTGAYGGYGDDPYNQQPQQPFESEPPLHQDQNQQPVYPEEQQVAPTDGYDDPPAQEVLDENHAEYPEVEDGQQMGEWCDNGDPYAAEAQKALEDGPEGVKGVRQESAPKPTFRVRDIPLEEIELPEILMEFEDTFYTIIGGVHFFMALGMIACGIGQFILASTSANMLAGFWSGAVFIACAVLCVIAARTERRRYIRILFFVCIVGLLASVGAGAMAVLAVNDDGRYTSTVQLDDKFFQRLFVDVALLAFASLEGVVCIGSIYSLATILSDEMTLMCFGKQALKKKWVKIERDREKKIRRKKSRQTNLKRDWQIAYQKSLIRIAELKKILGEDDADYADINIKRK